MSLYRDLFYPSHDGLRLYARDYTALPDRPTIVCIPGLTRNSADFEELCAELAGDYRLLAVDLRGRGRSDADPEPLNYHPATYAGDVVTLLHGEGIGCAIFIGTSLGGLVSMTLAATEPSLVKGIVLNDVGPELDPTGLARIRNYVSNGVEVGHWSEAVAKTREIQGQALPGLSDGEWEVFTRRLYREDDQGKPVLNYDRGISVLFETQSPDAAPPDLWPLFALLQAIPMLVVRGVNSDILSASVVARMAASHPRLRTLEVADRGHAPLLNEPGVLPAIRQFLQSLP